MADYSSTKSSGGKHPNMNKSEMILCSVDKKWEREDQFSKNELRKYNDGKRMRRPYNARCRKHTQGPRLELKCSECQLVKPLEDFSNAQRKEDDRRRCRLCVDYTETIDMFENMPVHCEDVARDDYQFQNNGPGDDGEEQPEEDPGVGGLATDSSALIAAHGRGHNVELTSTVLNRHNDSAPSFLQQGEYNPSSAPTDTASVTIDETRRAPGQPQHYVAYGPNGQRQQRVQSVITASDTASNATTAHGTTATTTRRVGWAKVKGRKMPVQAPDVLTQGKADEHFAPKRYDYSDSGSSDEC